MNRIEDRSLYTSNIVHVMSNQYVHITYYDKRTGQVSYTPIDSENVYTCYDYDLVSMGGLDHLRNILSEAAKNPESVKSHSVLQQAV